jgi:hypothetical protein
MREACRLGLDGCVASKGVKASRWTLMSEA